MKSVRASQLRKKIDIQKQKNAQDAVGGDVVTWSNFYVNKSAQPIHVKGVENFRAGQSLTEVDFIFKIRYLPGLDDNMRVVYKQKPYNIETIINTEERNRELQLFCNRVTT